MLGCDAAVLGGPHSPPSPCNSAERVDNFNWTPRGLCHDANFSILNYSNTVLLLFLIVNIVNMNNKCISKYSNVYSFFSPLFCQNFMKANKVVAICVPQNLVVWDVVCFKAMLAYYKSVICISLGMVLAGGGTSCLCELQITSHDTLLFMDSQWMYSVHVLPCTQREGRK